MYATLLVSITLKELLKTYNAQTWLTYIVTWCVLRFNRQIRAPAVLYLGMGWENRLERTGLKNQWDGPIRSTG